MNVMRWTGYALAGFVLLLLGVVLYARFWVGVNTPLGSVDLDTGKLEQQVTVPPGFSLGVFASGIENARILRFTRGGDLLVANPSLDRVMLLRDADGDGSADHREILLENLNGANGLDFFEDWLYVAETDAIGRVRFDHESGSIVGDYTRLVTGLPGGENHWKKTLRFGPDGLMYVAMGSSCNVCIEEDQRRAALVRYQPDGSGEEIFALGLRNSAGFDWSPLDGEIYATDNGRDLLGDDFPPCELNKVVEGGHYGWPFVNGNNQLDPDFGPGNERYQEEAIPPVHDFRAHNAPLGIEFVRGESFPAEYRGAAIVALHGSWNRTSKDGYKVVSLHWQPDGSIVERDFVAGFLKDDDVIGRPAEVTQGPDGAFYISDDYAGAIYRVAYGEGGGTAALPVAPAVVYDVASSLEGYSEADKARLGAEGEKLFRQYVCISCHNRDGRGLKKLVDLGSRYDVAALSQFLAKPRPPMPLFPLDEDDREALSVYLLQTY